MKFPFLKNSLFMTPVTFLQYFKQMILMFYLSAYIFKFSTYFVSAQKSIVSYSLFLLIGSL